MDALTEALDWHVLSIGEESSTLGALLVGLLILLVTLFVGRLARRALQNLFRRLNLQDGESGRIYGVTVQWIVWIIGIEVALHFIGIKLTTLFAATGFFAIAAGFAAKNILENLMSGSILRLERVIRTQDIVEVDGHPVIVEDVGLRTIKARTFDGVDMVIPNTIAAQSIVKNFTRKDPLHRLHVRVGVSYASDLEVVRETLEQAVDALEWRSAQRAPSVYLDDFGNSSIEYNVYVWIDNVYDTLARKSDLHEVVWRALKGADITIAYPQLDLHVDRNLIEAVASR